MKKNTSKLLTALVIFSAFGSASANIASKSYVDAQTEVKADLQSAGMAGELATVDANGQYVRSGESLSSLQADIDSKVDAVELQDYATKTEVSTGLAAKADDAATTAALAGKANVSTTYTKTEVDTALTGKADLQVAGDAGMVATVDANGQYIRSTTALTDVATSANLNLKADKTDTYTKTEVDTALTAKADDAATTAALADKADKSTTYTKTEVDTALTTKADASALAGKADVSALDAKADKSTTYTKTETDGLLDAKASTTSVTAVETSVTNLTTTVAGKADAATTIAGYGITDAYTKTQTDAALDFKVNEDDLGTLAKAAPGACASAANKCVLTFNGSVYEWEVIER